VYAKQTLEIDQPGRHGAEFDADERLHGGTVARRSTADLTVDAAGSNDTGGSTANSATDSAGSSANRASG
jgi:hypothetical protein